MNMGTAFGFGVIGAVIVYFCIFRKQRLETFLKAPKREWKLFAFDLIIYLVLGGCVTAFLFEASSVKEAVAIGGAWEGAVGGLTSIKSGVQKKIGAAPMGAEETE